MAGKLYGVIPEDEAPLSERNQAQAQQLGINNSPTAPTPYNPDAAGGINGSKSDKPLTPNTPDVYGPDTSKPNTTNKSNIPPAYNAKVSDNPAMSQEAAESDYANFEDVFNKNKNYAENSVNAVTDKVNDTSRGGAPTVAKPAMATNVAAFNKAQAPAPHALTAAPGSNVNTLGGSGNKSLPGNAPQVTQQAAETGGYTGGYAGYSPQPLQPGQTGNSAANNMAPAPAPVGGGGQSLDDIQKQADAIKTQASDEDMSKLDNLRKASDLMKGYNSDGGVDLLQQTYGPEATQYDADLMNTAGKDRLQALSKNTVGKDQEYADQLATELTANQKKKQDLLAGYNNGEVEGETAVVPGGVPSTSDTAQPAAEPIPGMVSDSAQDFLYHDPRDVSDFDENMHAAGMMMSPLDQLTIGLGDAGIYNGKNTTEIAMGSYGSSTGDSGVASDWGVANIKLALKRMDDEYGHDTAEALLQDMRQHPEKWRTYKGQNAGFIARQMRETADKLGYAKGVGHSLKAKAHAEGWGEAFTAQQQAGIKDPVSPNDPKYQEYAKQLPVLYYYAQQYQDSSQPKP